VDTKQRKTVRVVLGNGEHLPLYQPEVVADGVLVMKRDTPPVTMRLGSWTRRRLDAGDLRDVDKVAAAPAAPPPSKPTTRAGKE
jgi:hypothetical protein